MTRVALAGKWDGPAADRLAFRRRPGLLALEQPGRRDRAEASACLAQEVPPAGSRIRLA